MLAGTTTTHMSITQMVTKFYKQLQSWIILHLRGFLDILVAIRGKNEGSPLGWCGLNQPWRKFWSHDSYCTLKAAEKIHLASRFCQIPEASTHRWLENWKPGAQKPQSDREVPEVRHVLISKLIPCRKTKTLTPTQTNRRSYMRGGSSPRPAAEAVFIVRALQVKKTPRELKATVGQAGQHRTRHIRYRELCADVQV